MGFLRTRTAALALASIVALGAIVGASFEAAHERNDLRMHAAATTEGDPARGELMFIQYGCGSCHVVKRVRKAVGAVGPPLDGIAIRAVIAGRLDNTPANLQSWIRDPQHISPGTAMPDLNVGEHDARDITAFLYTRVQ